MFESSVNSEGIEAGYAIKSNRNLFESSVNSEGIEAESQAKLYGCFVWEQCKFRGYWSKEKV